ncbi:flagellar assembly protein A [Paenibacillus sp. WLX2291]|uniref:flagellar assembly protein A n=1 Tax=Paenibacillus sp. WLX2291 TaxID=3296934 RepID=UPI00398434BF
MERSVISKGKTVEQAVDRALALLEASKQDVSIEIIDEENKGVLGFNARPAVVKVTLVREYNGTPSNTNNHPNYAGADNRAATGTEVLERPLPLSDTDGIFPETATGSVVHESELRTTGRMKETVLPTEDEVNKIGNRKPDTAAVEDSFAQGQTEDLHSFAVDTSELQGKVWVADNRIQVKTFPGGALPRLDAFKSGDILINGEPLLAGQTAQVSEQDVIEVVLTEELREPVWEIQIDPDAMTVRLQVEPGSHIRRYLLDSPPESRLMLRVTNHKTLLPIEARAVQEQLNKLEVSYGLDKQALQLACETAEAGIFVIASGRLPVPGTDGSFEFKTDTQARKVQPKLRDDGTIDYRETREFPAVDEGDIIGVVLPAEPGTDGIDIYGRTVPAPPVRNVQIIPGKDVQLSADRLSAIALRAGMPSQTKQGYNIKLSIVPKLMHGGDVNLGTGNIHFLGDVEISGAVQDTMQVEAEGNIHIRSNVNMAQIIAGQSLIVNANVISSRIVVGQMYLFYGQIAPMLTYMEEQTELLKAAVRQVSSASAFKLSDVDNVGLAPLFQVLFQGRFRWMHDHMDRMQKVAEQYKSVLSEDWTRYFKEIQRGFLTEGSSHFRTADDLEGFMRRTRYLYSVVVLPAMEQIFSRFHFVQNSTIRCGGDIVIEKGSYNSHVHCEGRLQAGGALRGGTYYAGHSMTVEEAGSPGTGTTLLHVAEGGYVRVKHVLAGTTLRIGERIHQFVEDRDHVFARVNRDQHFVWHEE